MENKNEKSGGCGIALLICLLLLTWFIPEFIRSGGNAERGFNYIEENIWAGFTLLIVGIILYAFIKTMNKK